VKSNKKKRVLENKLLAAQDMLPAFLIGSQVLLLIGQKAVNQLKGKSNFIV